MEQQLASVQNLINESKPEIENNDGNCDIILQIFNAKQIILIGIGIATISIVLILLLSLLYHRKTQIISKYLLKNSATPKGKVFYRLVDLDFTIENKNSNLNQQHNNNAQQQFAPHLKEKQFSFPVRNLKNPILARIKTNSEPAPSGSKWTNKVSPTNEPNSANIRSKAVNCPNNWFPFSVQNSAAVVNNPKQIKPPFKGLHFECYQENILRCSHCLETESNNVSTDIFNTKHRHSAILKKNQKVSLSYGFKTDINLNWTQPTQKLLYNLTELNHENVAKLVGILAASCDEINKAATTATKFSFKRNANQIDTIRTISSQIDISTINEATINSYKNSSNPCLDNDKNNSIKSNRKMDTFSKSSTIEIGLNWRYYLIWNRYSRGSLADCIRDSTIKMNWPIKLSLLSDIVQGLKYLHESNLIESHGWLNSRNCFIDDRWQLKICDYIGFEQLLQNENRNGQPQIESQPPNKLELLWVAPECLRQPDHQQMFKCSVESDVYSFGIIIYEMLNEQDPYFSYSEPFTIDEILELIKHQPINCSNSSNRPATTKNPFRPEIFNHILQDYDFRFILKLMCKCWSERPSDRPTLTTINCLFETIHGECGTHNLIDRMVNKLDMFSKNMENLVRQKTEELELEKKKSEDLLYKVFPVPVADSLKTGKFVKPEKFECVTIFFSDIVGFTTIASYSEPIQVISVLNNLFTEFDNILSRFDVFKVETIGDAYLVVSGLPNRNNNHAEQIAMVSLEMLHFCTRFKIQHMPSIPLQIRIGIHTGSVVSGVIGTANPRYCLFGDSVNIASRLESTGLPNTIHISQSTERLLRQNNDFVVKYRGEISLRGRGMYPTYWLIGMRHFHKYLPTAELESATDCNNNHGINDETLFTSIGLQRQQL